MIFLYTEKHLEWSQLMIIFFSYDVRKDLLRNSLHNLFSRKGENT